MPAAANLNSAKVAGAEAAPAAAPGAPEWFAALVAAIGPVPDGAAVVPAGEGEGADAPEPGQPESNGIVDAAILLPMLDQQRAATPVGTVIAAQAGPRGSSGQSGAPASVGSAPAGDGGGGAKAD